MTNIMEDNDIFLKSVEMMTQRQAAERLQYFLGVTRKENPFMAYEIDGTVVEDEPALHPVGLLATTAQGTLAIPERLDGEQLFQPGDFRDHRHRQHPDQRRTPGVLRGGYLYLPD